MSARMELHVALSLRLDAVEAHRLANAYRAEVLAEVANPADAATSYAVRPCICDETPHPTWCPASVPTDERITEIRQGVGSPLTPRELFWLKGAAGRHELHVTGARGGHWPLTDDLPGALLLVSQYLAAATAVIERAGLVGEEATAAAATAAPELTVYRAEYPDSGITLGHYGTSSAARAHCQAVERRSWPVGTTLAFDWIEDDEDRVAELVVTAGQNEESITGYIVTALELTSEYDEEADE